MSTRQENLKRPTGRLKWLAEGRRGSPGDAEAVALVARARRDRLLAVQRHRLSREDLEDCYSQATLELLTRVARDGAFASNSHVANALEQRFVSRVLDRRRALGGRSPIEAATAFALPLGSGWEGEIEVPDARADVERLALARNDLNRIGKLSRGLTADQRLVLASQLAGELECGEFCQTHGWSLAKYRKVAQRARARLARLLAGEVICPGGPARSDQRAGTHL